jgi:hypothetical protein
MQVRAGGVLLGAVVGARRDRLDGLYSLRQWYAKLDKQRCSRFTAARWSALIQYVALEPPRGCHARERIRELSAAPADRQPTYARAVVPRRGGCRKRVDRGKRRKRLHRVKGRQTWCSGSALASRWAGASPADLVSAGPRAAGVDWSRSRRSPAPVELGRTTDRPWQPGRCGRPVKSTLIVAVYKC